MQKYNYALKILTMVWIFTSLVSLSPKATVLSPIIQKKPVGGALLIQSTFIRKVVKQFKYLPAALQPERFILPLPI